MQLSPVHPGGSSVVANLGLFQNLKVLGTKCTWAFGDCESASPGKIVTLTAIAVRNMSIVRRSP